MFIERYSRSLMGLWSYRDPPELGGHIDDGMDFYNHRRMHQNLDYATR